MYKIVIVDDEEYVINGIKKCIESQLQNIQVVGEAKNGLTAYKIIKKEKPDIVITDVFMPQMDGLEFIEKSLEIIPFSKFIVLSGYEDFQYAQKAIRSKVFDYILKPIEKEKIINIIKKAEEKITDENNKRNNIKKLKNQLEESLPILQERYLKYILSGSLSLNSVLEDHSYLNFDLSRGNFVVVAVEIYDNKEGKYEQMLALGIKKMIKDIINDLHQGEVVDEYFSKIIAIVNYNEFITRDNLIDSIENIGKRIKLDAKKYYDKTVTIGIGRVYRNADNIMNSYHEALEALEYKLFLGKEKIIFYNDVAVINNKKPRLPYPYSQEERILTSLNLGDTESISAHVSSFLRFYTQKTNITPDYLKRVCLQLVYIVFRKLSEWDISLDSIDYEEEEINNKIRSFNSYQDLKKYMIRFFEAISNYEKIKKNEYNQSTILKACSFIEKNYDKDLSLRSIADSVHLTRTYFANLFKERTGKTVMAYLKDIRMEKAKELLKESEYMIYEIAEKVGYNNPNYFAKVFKEYNGVSPNEYRSRS